MKKIFSIYKKELKELFRDKKTVFMAIIFPLILYPVLIAIVSILTVKGQDNIDSVKSKIALGPDMGIAQKIKENEDFHIVSTEDYKKDLDEGELDLYIESQEKDGIETYRVYYDSSRENGKEALSRFEEVAEEYREEVQREYLGNHGIEIDLLNMVTVEKENIAEGGKEGRSLIASIVPMFLLIPVFLACLYSAFDLTSGEKERKTLETLMTLPVRKEEILLAKLFSTVTFGGVSLLVNASALGITVVAGTYYVEDFRQFISESLSVPFIASMVISIIPILFFVSGLALLIGIIAKDYKEAQSYASPLSIMLVIPMYFIIYPGWNLEGFLAYVPIVNVFLLMKLIGVEGVVYGPLVSVFIYNMIISVIAMIVFGKLFKSETILFSQEKGFNFSFKRMKKTRKNSLEVSEVALFYLVLLIFLILIGGILQLKLGLTGVVLTQYLLILLPSILVLYTLNIDIKGILRLKRTEGRNYIKATGLWAVGFIVIIAYTLLQTAIFPDSLDSMEELGEFFGNANLLESILFFSVTPAICEEIMFRGVIFGSLEKKIGAKKAIIISGALFGIFHIYPAKMVATGMLGMVFAFVTYATGSIFPSMFLHFLNNSFSLVVTPKLQDAGFAGQYGIYVFGVFIVLVIVGINWIVELVKVRRKRLTKE